MKVVLFHPALTQKDYSSCWIPYSVLSIASAVDVPVSIIDNNLYQRNDLSGLVEEYIDADTVVGISVMLGRQVTEGIELARLVKKKDSAIQVIVGGPMATLLPDILLQEDAIDLVVRGQGEQTFWELIRNFRCRPVSNFSRIDEIPGVVYRSRQGIVFNDKRRVVPRTGLPRYNFDLIDAAPYVLDDPTINTRTLNYCASQGCPHRCGFCSDTNLFDGRWAYSSADIIAEDVLDLKRRYAINGIKFYDSNFFVNRRLPVEFANRIMGEAVLWGASIHPRDFMAYSDDDLEIMQNGGLRRLLIGIESPVQEILNHVGKRFIAANYLQLAAKVKRHGLMASYTMIVGFPGFPEDHYRKTIDFGKALKEMDDDCQVKIHFYTPVPGTRLFPEALQNGYVMPQALDEWMDFDYLTNVAVPWISDHNKAQICEFNATHKSAVNRHLFK